MGLRHEKLTDRIIGAAIRVHRSLGPGLLESVYETFLAHELVRQGLTIQRQALLSVVHDGVCIEAGYRVDVLVEDTVIVELKSVTRVEPVHVAQLLTYLRLSGKPVGLLVNFNVVQLREGIVLRVL